MAKQPIIIKRDSVFQDLSDTVTDILNFLRGA